MWQCPRLCERECPLRTGQTWGSLGAALAPRTRGSSSVTAWSNFTAIAWILFSDHCRLISLGRGEPRGRKEKQGGSNLFSPPERKPPDMSTWELNAQHRRGGANLMPLQQAETCEASLAARGMGRHICLCQVADRSVLNITSLCWQAAALHHR